MDIRPVSRPICIVVLEQPSFTLFLRSGFINLVFFFREKELVIRWDLVYEFFTEHKHLMQYTSLNAVNVSDKQDPSHVTDISCLHEHFAHHGYKALGMFFKAVHFLAEAFLDKTLDPYQRAYKAWWTKTFFVLWNEHSTYSSQCVTSQTLKDIICSCDGLILYFQILKKRFPEAKVVPYYLGSDQNEQLFAFIRTSYSGGRSRNLDAIKLAFGMERKNVRSGLSLPEDTTAIAHTRGRTVLRKAVPLVGKPESVSATNRKDCEWTGTSLNQGKLQKVMDQASKDCITEGKRYRFPVFMNVPDPEERTGRPIPLHIPTNDDINEDDQDVEDEEFDEDYLPVECNEDDCEEMLSTKLYGKLNFRTAETLLLNGGRSSFTTKSRMSRFTGDAFGMSSDIRIFNQSACACRDNTLIGQVRTLPTFENLEKCVKGEVRFLSYKGSPLKFYCNEHSLVGGKPNAWLLVRRKFVRCVIQ